MHSESEVRELPRVQSIMMRNARERERMDR